MRPHRHALANCSLLDEATAAAEAVTMMYALRPRDMQKSGANVVFVDEAVFPQTLAVMTTRAIPQGIELRIGKYHEMEFTPDIFACVLQYPNAAGNVEDYRAFVEKAHAANCKVAVAADILSLALLTSGRMGAGHRLRNHTTARYTDVLRWAVGSLLCHPRRVQAQYAGTHHRLVERQIRQAVLPHGAANPRATYQA